MTESMSEDLRRKSPASIVVPEGEIRVLESHHAADFQMQMDAWLFHKICWVAIGSGQLEAHSGFTTIQQNDFLLLPAGWSHRFIDEPGRPLTLVILCISESHLSSTRSRPLGALWDTATRKHPAGEAICAKTGFHLSRMIGQFRLARREQNDQQAGWRTALEAVVARLLLSFVRSACEQRANHTNSGLQAVDGAIEYLCTHPNEALQIHEMAARCGLSPRRFTDLFKQRTGATFTTYLNHNRIEYACRRLQETSHILYACHESGFNDLAYFYRVFRKVKGMTPGEFLERKKTR